METPIGAEACADPPVDSLGDSIQVWNAGPLSGQVDVPGAKNSVLKLMAAALLADGDYELTNVPNIVDVGIMSELLGAIGVLAEPVAGRSGVLRLCNEGRLTPEAPYEIAVRIRASINVLGPLLTRCGRVRICMPGGDDFGSRPIDLHLSGLEAMGATFDLHNDYIEGRADRLHGADIELAFPSVGATENLMMAAVYASGTTVIENAAREPEISDIAEFLRAMGADIEGIGTSTVVVHGVERATLRGVSHQVVPDRIQAATYLAALGVAGGEMTITGARPEQMGLLLRRLREMGMGIEASTDRIVAASHERLRSVDMQTLPYPGLATDYKPLLVTMLTVADGVGIVTENLYPGRFRYVDELVRMGADVRQDGHHAVVRGVDRLHGAAVEAADIRAGAALVVAGLAATGQTVIGGVHHIDRGYDDLVGRLRTVGAGIMRAASTADALDDPADVGQSLG